MLGVISPVVVLMLSPAGVPLLNVPPPTPVITGVKVGAVVQRVAFWTVVATVGLIVTVKLVTTEQGGGGV